MNIQLSHKIQLTQNDIKQGKRYNSLMCPIALAIQRVTGGRVSVNASRAEIFDGSKLVATYKMPLEASNIIYHIDLGREVKPLGFEILIKLFGLIQTYHML